MWATRAHHRRHVLLLQTTGISHFSFWSDPGHLREIPVSAFSRSLFGRADTFAFKNLPSTPRIYLCSSLLPPHFLTPDFHFLLFSVELQSCTRQPCLHIVHILSLLPNQSVSFLLRYPALFEPDLLLLSSIMLYIVWPVTSFLEYIVLSKIIRTFSRHHLIKWVHS